MSSLTEDNDMQIPFLVLPQRRRKRRISCILHPTSDHLRRYFSLLLPHPHHSTRIVPPNQPAHHYVMCSTSFICCCAFAPTINTGRFPELVHWIGCICSWINAPHTTCAPSAIRSIRRGFSHLMTVVYYCHWFVFGCGWCLCHLLPLDSNTRSSPTISLMLLTHLLRLLPCHHLYQIAIPFLRIPLRLVNCPMIPTVCTDV